jgi:hypothetical protein
MEIILEELERLQKQLCISLKKSSSKSEFYFEKDETPLDTLRKTRLLQIILRDPNNKQQRNGSHSRRTRPYSND